jgi:hypothetical protein
MLLKGGIFMDFFEEFTRPYIFLSGEGVRIEGLVKIEVWEKTSIILRAKEKIKIAGRNLRLDFRGQGIVLIRGKVICLEFEE